MPVSIPPLPDPASALVDSTGRISEQWYRFFNSTLPAIRLAASSIQDIPTDDTILHNNETDTLTVGFLSDPFDNGTKSSGTFTVDAANGSLQYVSNGGAFTLGLPADGTSVQLLIINVASAGAINLSAFDFIAGDDLDTVVGNEFMASVSNINGRGTFTAIAAAGNT
jgi:hypothetical protein